MAVATWGEKLARPWFSAAAAETAALRNCMDTAEASPP